MLDLGISLASVVSTRGPRLPTGFGFLVLNGAFLTVSGKRLILEH